MRTKETIYLCISYTLVHYLLDSVILFEMVTRHTCLKVFRFCSLRKAGWQEIGLKSFMNKYVLVTAIFSPTSVSRDRDSRQFFWRDFTRPRDQNLFLVDKFCISINFINLVACTNILIFSRMFHQDFWHYVACWCKSSIFSNLSFSILSQRCR